MTITFEIKSDEGSIENAELGEGTFILTLDAEEGSLISSVLDQVTVVPGEAYEHTGWLVADDETVYTAEELADMEITAGMTITAVMELLPDITITAHIGDSTFEDLCGDYAYDPDAQTVTYTVPRLDAVNNPDTDRNILVSTRPVEWYTFEYNASGFWFGGWYRDADFSEPLGDFRRDDRDLEIYAKWMPNQYKIYLNVTDGGHFPDYISGSVTQGYIITNTIEDTFDFNLPDPERPGYIFKGWKKYEDPDSPIFENGLVYHISQIGMGSRLMVPMYSVWEEAPVTYTITYVGAEQGNNPGSYTADEEVILEDAVKNGYVFEGWYYDQDFNTPVENNRLNTSVAMNLTVYAKFTAKKYTVTLNANGGSFADGNTVELNRTFDTAEILFSEIPEREGFNFLGWAKSADAEEAEYFDWTEYTNISETGDDITLYAVWEAKEIYTIIFDPNGGSLPLDASGNVDDGRRIYEKAWGSVWLYIDDPVRNGYQFKGWSSDGTASGQMYEIDKEYSFDDFVFDENHTCTLYAVWEAEGYVISFNLNGGTGEFEDLVLTADSEVILSDRIPEYEGYKFLGWSQGGSDDGKIYNPGGSYRLSDFNVEEGMYEINLFAVWEAEEYTIIFDPNGGRMVADASGNIDNGIRTCTALDEYIWIYVNEPVKNGYSFVGWSNDGTASGTIYWNGSTVPFDEFSFDENNTCTLYAVWGETHRIIYANTSNGDNPLVYTDGDENIYLYDVEKTGYTFDGWYYDSAFTQPVVDRQLDTTQGKDLTVYAKFDANHYQVTYDANGGEFPAGAGTGSAVTYNAGLRNNEDSIVSQEMVFDQTSALTSDKPARGGYKFAGWAKDQDSSTVVYKSGANYKNISEMGTDITLYAVYTSNKYTVKYDANAAQLKEIAGSDLAVAGKVADRKNVYPTDRGLIPDAVYSAKGYRNIGWASEPGASEPDVTVTTALEDILKPSHTGTTATLYAVWEASDYVVILHSQGASAEEISEIVYTVDSGVSADELTAPVMEDPEHYSFEGWYRSTAFKASEKVESIAPGEYGDIDLYAHIVPKTYTLNFTDGEGKTVVKKVKYGEMFFFNTVKFTKKGYLPNGWIIGDESESEAHPLDYMIIGTNWGSVFGSGEYEASVKQTWVEIGGDGPHVLLYALTQYGLTFDDIELEEGSVFESTDKDGATYSVKKKAGETIRLPKLKEKTGNYKFNGWIRGSDGKKATSVGASESNLPEHSLDYYASWTVKNYKITYNANAPKGTKVNGKMNAVTRPYNNVYSIPGGSGYYIEGYDFKGWSTDKAAVTPEYAATGEVYNVTVKNNITLYAVWEPREYSVTLDTPIGHFDNGDTQKTVTFTKAEKSVLEAPVSPYQALKFDGYYESTELKGTKITDTSKIKYGGMLFAKWAGAYTIRYHDTEGDKVVSQNAKFESNCTLKANAFKHSGMVFSGWRCKGFGVIGDKAKITPTYYGYCTVYGMLDYMTEEDGRLYLDLYAVFDEDKNTQYYVNLDCMGGSIGGRDYYWTSYLYGTGITANEFKNYLTPVRKGYIFQGWYNIETDAKVTSISKKDAGYKSLYAKWKGEKVKITFDLNNPDPTGKTKIKGSMKAVSGERGTYITFKNPALTAEGYYFYGWSTEKYDAFDSYQEVPFENLIYDGYHYTDDASEVQLHAVWVKGNTYHYLFTSGGRIIDDSVEVLEENYSYRIIYTCDISKVLPVPVKEGYTFEGWYSTPDLKGKAVTNLNAGMNESFYAKWKMN